MSKETAKEFYEALKSDKALVEELQKQISTIGDKNQESVAAVVVKFAADKGYDFTAGDLKELNSEVVELDKDELDNINAAITFWVSYDGKRRPAFWQ